MSELQGAAQEGTLRAPEPQNATGKIDSFAGTISLQIGSGDHAQYAIVYRTIFWSFLAGGLLSVGVFIFSFAKDSAAPISIKDIWSVFAPLITLALGYLFGKGK